MSCSLKRKTENKEEEEDVLQVPCANCKTIIVDCEALDACAICEVALCDKCVQVHAVTDYYARADDERDYDKDLARVCADCRNDEPTHDEVKRMVFWMLDNQVNGQLTFDEVRAKATGWTGSAYSKWKDERTPASELKVEFDAERWEEVKRDWLAEYCAGEPGKTPEEAEAKWVAAKPVLMEKCKRYMMRECKIEKLSMLEMDVLDWWVSFCERKHVRLAAKKRYRENARAAKQARAEARVADVSNVDNNQ